MLGLLIAALPSWAAEEGSGLPLPRFASMRPDEVNLRTGPGLRYPVEWVYRRQGLPVEIVSEYGTWRKIRDWQGTQGWVHQSMLTGRRTVIVLGDMRALRARPDTKAEVVAQVEAGVIGHVKECPAGLTWCKVSFLGLDGWLRRAEVWGVYPNELVDS